MSLSIFSASNIHQELLKFATEKTIETVKPDKIYIASKEPLRIPQYFEQCILPEDFTRDEYNHMVYKSLNSIIDTDHVLVFQYDGFAVNTNAWTDEFYEYDYIGAPLNALNPCMSWDIGSRRKYKWFVGNGGFSLRSKKLLEVLQKDDSLTPEVKTNNGDKILCEDIAISFDQRKYLKKKYGIKFAPLDVALRFSMESVKGEIYSLGFHGLQNIPYFLNEADSKHYFELYVKSSNISLYHIKSFFTNCIEKNYFNLAQYISKGMRKNNIEFPTFKV